MAKKRTPYGLRKCPICHKQFTMQKDSIYYILTKENYKTHFCSYTCYRTYHRLNLLKDLLRKQKKIITYFDAHSDAPEIIKTYLTDLYMYADKKHIHTEYFCEITSNCLKESENKLRKDLDTIKRILEKEVNLCIKSKSSLERLTKIAIKQSVPTQIRS